MKKQVISAVSAAAIVAGSVFGVFAVDNGTSKEVLSPRATVEIIDGQICGITEPISASWLKSQFDGDVTIRSGSGENISDDKYVPSDSVVIRGEDTLAAVTIPGDSSKDGQINLADASAILKHVAKWGIDISEKAADVNRDTKINISDISLLLKYIAKWDVQIFDGEIMLPIFSKGITDYKIFAEDPAVSDVIIERLKALTGTTLEAVDSIGEDDRVIIIGRDLHKKYDFIDGNAVYAMPEGSVYVDTYDEDLYVTAPTEELCIDYVTYRMFTAYLDASFPKGSFSVVPCKEITYTELIKDGNPIYSPVIPQLATYTLKAGVAIIEQKIKDDFYPKFTVFTDGEDDEAVFGEYDSDYEDILIGQTDRRESRDVFMTLSPGEYTIRAVSNKLVILGYNDDLTYLATKHFAEYILPLAKDKTLTLPEDFNIIIKPYAIQRDSTSSVEIEDIVPVGDPIELSCETWVAAEMEFTSDVDYTDPVYTVEMDAVIRNPATGEAFLVPAFWDGGRSFKVRFALPEAGEWKFYTKCSDTGNNGLHHRAGTITCTEYSGDLAIYKHGFVKTEPGKNYFVYDDGTPFFYLGDTHWSLPIEEIDSYGSVETQQSSGITEDIAKEYGITSQFRYIMDYRAEQGYTVIQSQPLSWWSTAGQNSWFGDDGGNIYTYGVNDSMLAKFQEYDRRFAYIAELGLVHANSQLSCVSTLMTEYFAGNVTDEELDKLCRYWVARYSAYPVLWTTAQEGDNDYYGEDRETHEARPDNNPWHTVMDSIHKYDPYAHPSTCHQEHWFYTTAKNSSFADREGHTWYAAQYYLLLHMEDPFTWQFFRDYYGNPGFKPAINYEGRYDHFWVGTYGARAQGWQAFLNGNFGYGYGVQPIWALNWSFVEGLHDSSDELGSYNRDDNWLEGLYADGGKQVAYMKEFLEKYEWWKLVPCFNRSYYYEPNGWGYSVSTIGNDVYLGYFYGTNEAYRGLGTLRSMKNGDYTVTWFNCRTGKYEDPFTVTVTDGTYRIPKKPGDGDWTIAVEYIGK